MNARKSENIPSHRHCCGLLRSCLPRNDGGTKQEAIHNRQCANWYRLLHRCAPSQ
ncbi:MAG: hypothetical protein LBE13_22150 [Bacteroidales bacterium]|nr:hypothetical protein [Bacteroidales bacterium]